jgi:hypothetical protein
MNKSEIEILGNQIKEVHDLDDVYSRLGSFLCWKNKRLYIVSIFYRTEPDVKYIATSSRNSSDAFREIGSPCDSKEMAIRSLKFQC